jgi:manganese transport protein
MTLNFFGKHSPRRGAIEILRYIGPGFIVTVGFVDPGNWAANIAAGASHGYHLLWMVTFSTFMLIVLQHNAAHLGIVTGLCLSEASTQFFPKLTSRIFLISAVLAAACTALAEILGAAIGLNMLLGLPLTLGSILTVLLVVWMLFSSSYRRLERWIIGFVSLIGLSLILELFIVKLQWTPTLKGLFIPSFPEGALPIIMSVLGAVVMPHNLFLHSEIIQSRQWNLETEKVMERQLRFEFADTLFAMAAGWAINSALIIMAASVFYSRGIIVTDLAQAEMVLRPMAGPAASTVFAIALIFAGFSSAVTAAMAGGSIFAGFFAEPLDLKDTHSQTGIFITLLGGLLPVFFLTDPFQGIIWSQIALSVQLPLTIVALVLLTSSKRVMGRFANYRSSKFLLMTIAAAVIILDAALLLGMI